MTQTHENNNAIRIEDINRASERLLRKCQEIITPKEVLSISLKQAKKAILTLNEKGLEVEKICELFNDEFSNILESKCTTTEMQEFINNNIKNVRKKSVKNRM